MKLSGGSLAFLMVAAACGAPSAPTATAIEPLDPQQPHYGKSYTEWAAAWVEWVYEWPETAACPDPIADTTGALCAFGQDPNSSVFFLGGDWGGVARRPSCVAPAGKALFMPIYVGTFQDNGGVPATMVKTDAQLKASAAAELQPVRKILFSVDGNSVSLGPYAIVAAPYQYTLPREPNIFTCQGSLGVTGTYSGYASGYFVLLPPLSVGPHTIAFSAKQDMTPTSAAFSLDVEYDPLTIR
ncbi:MAG TPA: hypothetical protein VGY54_04740 [Polyangiaceae bacterium]|nr:hypothetical protein [Polyangiaceae bacterium]